jgi:Uma2 family endonuclease
MITQEGTYTVEEFDQFVLLPENADRLFEYIGGEMFEVVSNNLASAISAAILAEIHVFAKKNKLGWVTGADGGYIVGGERYIPDVAFISRARQKKPLREAYNPNPPDLAVEVISSDRGDELHALRIKVINYLAAGTMVWVVMPEDKQIEVYTPGQPVKIHREKDTLDGGAVLPGFTLKIADIFES